MWSGTVSARSVRSPVAQAPVMGLVVEVQRTRDVVKRWSWPLEPIVGRALGG